MAVTLGSHGYSYMGMSKGASLEQAEGGSWCATTMKLQVAAVSESVQTASEAWTPPTVVLADTVFKGEGTLLSTTPIHLAGRVSFNTHSTQLLMDGWTLLSGPGDLTIGKNTSVMLGVNSTLNGNATITVHGRLSVDSHVNIILGGYAIVLCPGSGLSVMGTLNMGSAGRIEECGGTYMFRSFAENVVARCTQASICDQSYV
ncbi:hypothetical protein CYMTET_25934 [Cymbomonas tetramitiformis]|uniref:Uncharacterized protein n=1 Tax=Cymbomonas tetramitiformis TaxID=36881 RepID=A0AAE0FSV5_9CHLO|nr:hypothetical protein CYMTET_25934 [Cymbomonas tetramitiformis]